MTSMAGNRRQGVIALLTIVAVILTAVAVGPLFSAEQGGQRVPGLEQPPLDGGSSQPGEVEAPLVRAILAAMAVIGLLATLVQFVTEPWKSFKLLVGLTAGLAVFVAGFWLLLSLPNRSPAGGPATPRGTIQAPPTAAGTPGFGSGSEAPLVLPVGGATAVIIVAAVVAVLAVFAWQSDALRSVLSAEEGGEADAVDADLSTLAQVAGDTADRVEAAETPRAADNAIYRAWREMVGLLGVGDPQEATPRQFEATAIEEGMDPEDVGVLTETFEAVRYGDAPLTEQRRERAVAALERIEATHGTEETTETGRGDDTSKGGEES